MPPFFTPWALFLNCLLLFIVANPVSGQQELPELDVSGRPWGEDIVGPYHQPRWSARGRFSADTDVYVLPPYSLFLDLDYHGTFPRHRGKPDHVFVQEIEMGLPYRFQIAWEFYQELTNGHRQLPQTLVEARYAFADWGKFHSIRLSLGNINGASIRISLTRAIQATRKARARAHVESRTPTNCDSGDFLCQ